jgi:glycosyltransferase involved in cell wall biosynthesis
MHRFVRDGAPILPMSDPPRFLHLITCLDRYGVARLLRELAARQTAAGRTATVAPLRAASREVAAELRAAGVVVAPLGGRWAFDPIAVWRLARLRQRGGFDVVHAWDPAALVHATISGRCGRLVAGWTGAGQTPAWIARLASPAVAALPPGAAPPTAPPLARDAALRELGLAADARVIALAGPLARHKEFDEAIWNFELVRVLHPAARLVLFGDGPDRPRLERYADLVSEPGCVRFAGYRGDWLRLAAALDVFWQLDPARTTPFALLEAMAAGVPAVVSNLPALTAAVEHDATGLVVRHRVRADVARATDQLLSDAALARRLADAARVVVQQRWSLDKSAAVCEALYRAGGAGS